MTYAITVSWQTKRRLKMEKKYELITNAATPAGFFRVRALRNFAGVMAGDLGGFIQHEGNLSHAGNAQISGTAWVSGDARVSDGTRNT